MSDTSPRDREIERFKLHAAFHGYSLNPDPQGEYVRFSDLQARETEIREAAQIALEDQSRARTAAEKQLAEVERISIEQDKERIALEDRAEKAEALVAEARAELERRLTDAEKWEGRHDAFGSVRERAEAVAETCRRLLALLTATPCSDQGEDCERCMGDGLFRGDYPCGKCNGTGKKSAGVPTESEGTK